MSLYNMLMGFNSACVILMPMLGRKAEEYPRFRDCFLEDDKIAIYTRVGGKYSQKKWNFCPNCEADMRGEQNE